MSNKAVIAVLVVVIMLLGCSAPERTTFKEAYFAYLAAVEIAVSSEDISEILSELGWSREELERKVQRIRHSDPEGFTALLNEYRARTGLPK
jgi:uncharacterized lipoprotein NlpE involved in copper resistance